METQNLASYLPAVLEPASEIALGGANLEIKAPLDSIASARERLREIGAACQGVERQVDLYFVVAAGRLKLRVSSRDGAHLVAYLRPDSGRFRESRFHRLPVEDPDTLAETLTSMLGAGSRVIKTRELWWWHDVRVHLDEVEERGTFVELEARLDRIGDPDAAAERLDRLCVALEITPDPSLSGSYGEMPCRPTT